MVQSKAVKMKGALDKAKAREAGHLQVPHSQQPALLFQCSAQVATATGQCWGNNQSEFRYLL